MNVEECLFIEIAGVRRKAKVPQGRYSSVYISPTMGPNVFS